MPNRPTEVLSLLGRLREDRIAFWVVGGGTNLLVADEVIVEVKSVETIHPVHEAQLLSYLRLAQKDVGLVINFNVAVLKKGIRRKIRRYMEAE